MEIDVVRRPRRCISKRRGGERLPETGGASTGPHNEIRRCKMRLRRGNPLAYLTEKSSSLPPRHLNEREAAGSRARGAMSREERRRLRSRSRSEVRDSGRAEIEQEQRESASSGCSTRCMAAGFPELFVALMPLPPLNTDRISLFAKRFAPTLLIQQALRRV